MSLTHFVEIWFQFDTKGSFFSVHQYQKATLNLLLFSVTNQSMGGEILFLYKYCKHTIHTEKHDGDACLQQAQEGPREILGENLMQSARNLQCGRTIVFQQEKKPKNKVKGIQAWLKNYNVESESRSQSSQNCVDSFAKKNGRIDLYITWNE